MTTKKYLNLSEASSYLGISTHTLYKWCERRIITFTHSGRRLMFPIASLDAYLERNMVLSIDEASEKLM